MEESDTIKLLEKMPDELIQHSIRSALEFIHKAKADFDATELLSVFRRMFHFLTAEIDQRRRRMSLFSRRHQKAKGRAFN